MLLFITPKIHQDIFFLTINSDDDELKVFLTNKDYINYDKFSSEIFFSRDYFLIFLDDLMTGGWINQEGLRNIFHTMMDVDIDSCPSFFTFNELEMSGYLEKLIKTYKDYKFLFMFLAQSVNYNGKAHTCSILGYAVLRDWRYVTEKLLNYGGYIQVGLIDTTGHVSTSPLELAVMLSNLEIIRLILRHKPDLLTLNAKHESLLMTALLTGSLETIQFILDAAQESGQLGDLISLKNSDGDTVYEAAAHRNFFDALEHLVGIENFHQHIDIQRFLSRLRVLCWRNPAYQQPFNKLIKTVRPLCHSRPKLFDIKCSLSVEDSFLDLYDVQPVIPAGSKEEAIKLVIAQYFSLLLTPTRCFVYLRFLNDELKRYYFSQKAHPIPVLDQSTLRTGYIDSVPYPFADENFVGLGHKDHCLQAVLMSLLRRVNLATECYEWERFIPADIANAQIRRGDFTIENPYGGSLFHGVLSHAIQSFLLACAWENGEFNQTYFSEGKEEKLSLEDVNNGFLIYSTSTGTLLWDRVRDQYYEGYQSFATPHYIYPLIIFFGREFNCQELADVLTDSFIKQTNKCWKALQKETEFSSMTREDFFEQLGDLAVYLFESVPSILALADKPVDEPSRQVVYGGSANTYTVRKRDFPISTFFKPRSFEQYQAETVEGSWENRTTRSL